MSYGFDVRRGPLDQEHGEDIHATVLGRPVERCVAMQEPPTVQEGGVCHHQALETVQVGLSARQHPFLLQGVDFLVIVV